MRAIFALLAVTNVLVTEISASCACTLLNNFDSSDHYKLFFPRNIYDTCLYHLNVCATNSLETLHILLLVPQMPISYGSRRLTMADCISENLEWLRPHLIKGVPGLNIPPYKPYHITEYYDIRARSSSNQTTWINDLAITGLTDYQISNIKFLPYQMDKTEFQAYFPRIDVAYHSNMYIDILNLYTLRQVKIEVSFENATAVVSLSGDFFMKNNGDRYFEVTEVNVTLTYERISVTPHRSNPSPDILYDVVEITSNKRLQTVMSQMLPKIERNAANVIKELANKFYSRCPVRMLF